MLRILILFVLAGCGAKTTTPKVAETSDAQASAAEAAVEENEAPADPRYVWDLTDLYPSPDAWDSARKDVLARVAELPRHKGTLNKSAKHLREVAEEFWAVSKDLSRVYIYTSLSRDEDQRVTEAQSRFELSRAAAAEFSKATAWMSPELLAMGQKQIEQFIKADPGLKPYVFFLRDTVRLEPHTLDAQGEGMLASASLLLSSPTQIYQLLTNADIEWPTVTLADGTEEYLNQAAYTRLRAVPNRADREKVMDEFFATFGQFIDSIGATMAANIQGAVFTARARKFNSSVEAALASDNIPVQVYDTLLEETNKALPTLHRYFKLRARMLGVSNLGYYDIYPPLVELAEADTYDIEKSKEITLVALEPFGADYVEKLKYAFSQKWMHGKPARGKRSGAYMSGGAYDVHPYILLNHNDDYESLSTFAHEWGHAVHSLLANESQPHPTADYSIFTAEMASTINEILLVEYMIKNAKTREEKLFFLGGALESIRGTLFRQAMFGEFERAVHVEAEKGAPLSGTRMSEIYLDLLRRYHGHSEGVMEIKEVYGNEWAYIPHFYYNFYVYQYATSISGAAWFAEKFLNGDDSARVAFLNVLRAGGSDYPYDILKNVGLDLAAPEPYRAAFRRMNDIMDRIESLLDEPKTARAN
ncbi:MAG: oligoendopeptidase F [Myxococcota bacterium]